MASAKEGPIEKLNSEEQLKFWVISFKYSIKPRSNNKDWQTTK